MDSDECEDDAGVTPCQNLIKCLTRKEHKPNAIQKDKVPEAAQVREKIHHTLIHFPIIFYYHVEEGQASKDYLGEWRSYYSWQHHWLRNIHISKGSSH